MFLFLIPQIINSGWKNSLSVLVRQNCTSYRRGWKWYIPLLLIFGRFKVHLSYFGVGDFFPSRQHFLIPRLARYLRIKIAVAKSGINKECTENLSFWVLASVTHPAREGVFKHLLVKVCQERKCRLGRGLGGALIMERRLDLFYCDISSLSSLFKNLL